MTYILYNNVGLIGYTQLYREENRFKSVFFLFDISRIALTWTRAQDFFKDGGSAIDLHCDCCRSPERVGSRDAARCSILTDFASVFCARSETSSGCDGFETVTNKKTVCEFVLPVFTGFANRPGNVRHCRRCSTIIIIKINILHALPIYCYTTNDYADRQVYMVTRASVAT